MTKQEKQKEIKKIEKKQLSILKQSIKICKLNPPKTAHSAIKRAAKICGLQIMINKLQSQKYVIASQPNPNFPKGGFVDGTISQNPIIDKEEKIIQP